MYATYNNAQIVGLCTRLSQKRNVSHFYLQSKVGKFFYSTLKMSRLWGCNAQQIIMSSL